MKAVSKQPMEAALTAMLPWEYRISRACNMLQKKEWFIHWKLLPRDWHEGGRSMMMLMPKFKGDRPRSVMRAEIFDTSGMAIKAMTAMTREANNRGPAWLATHVALREQRFGDDEEATREAIFGDEFAGGCRSVERCLSRLREIKSRVLGELVMAELQKLDEVAYIRFASVYRRFQDLNEFREEIERLSREPAKPE